MLCFKIEIFMFSFLLSFIIDLYNFILLTPSISNDGINIIFCKNIVRNIKINPFNFPKVKIHADIVYPKQKPLAKIIPNTIGIPIIVVPENHNRKTSNIFDLISFFNSSKKFPV